MTVASILPFINLFSFIQKNLLPYRLFPSPDPFKWHSTRFYYLEHGYRDLDDSSFHINLFSFIQKSLLPYRLLPSGSVQVAFDSVLLFRTCKILTIFRTAV